MVSVIKKLFLFVVEKCELQLSEDDEKKLKECLRVYCMNMSKRWQKCSRVLRTFALKYNAWLQEEFKIPEESISRILSRGPSTSDNKFSVIALSKRKNFNDVSDRHKRKLTKNLREQYDSDVLLFAAKQRLQCKESTDLVRIIDYLITNPSETGRIRDFCEKKTQAPHYQNFNISI